MMNGRESIDTLVARVGDLPAMPTIAVKVMEMIGDPSTSAARLQSMISKDQALTAKVLKIANSAMFGVPRDISTLSHAVVILGFSTIRSIVLAASTRSLYSGMKGQRGFSAKLLWEHSLASASVARQIAKAVKGVDVEEAFIAGLLHDIGKNVLNNNFPTEYSDVVRDVYNSGKQFQEIERRILGFDHTQVGALLARKWNLAVALEEAVLHHHSSERAEINPELTAVVSLANLVTVKLGIGPTRNIEVTLTSSAPARSLSMGPGVIEGLLESMQQLIQKETEVFNI